MLVKFDLETLISVELILLCVYIYIYNSRTVLRGNLKEMKLAKERFDNEINSDLTL